MTPSDATGQKHQPETSGGLIRNISDTARWVAVYRAQETERSDALFRDPFARRLAGERGERIAESKPVGGDATWSMVARTYLFDQIILASIARGTDMVINLAAGLDARPYRMQLPATLQWVEVDLPEILAYKEEILRDEQPVCSLERHRLNLQDVDARRKLFAELGERAKNVLLITEGLITYLDAQEVGQLATDLASPASFREWVLDLGSPALLRILRKRLSAELREKAPFKFAPEDGPNFFTRFAWNPVEVRSLLKTSARLKRLSWRMRLLAMLPDGAAPWRRKPWAAVCLFRKIKA